LALLLDSILMPLPNPAVDDQLYRLIGQIVVTFNSVEALLRECAAESLGPNMNLSLVVLSRASFSDLLGIFKITSSVTLASRPDAEELQKKADEVVKDLGRVNESRNAVVHSHYGDQI
jgi:hypothetical protein